MPRKNTIVARTIVLVCVVRRRFERKQYVVPDVWIPWTVHDNSYASAQKLFHSLLIVLTQKKEVDHEAHK